MKKELNIVGLFLLVVTIIALVSSLATIFFSKKKNNSSLTLLTNYIKQVEPFSTKIVYFSDDNIKESYIITNTENGLTNIIEINFINKTN